MMLEKKEGGEETEVLPAARREMNDNSIKQAPTRRHVNEELASCSRLISWRLSARPPYRVNRQRQTCRE